MKSPAVVNYSSEPHSVELREVSRPEPGPEDIILAVEAVGLSETVKALAKLGDLPRALARLLMGGGGGSDYQLNSKVRAQAAAWRRQA